METGCCESSLKGGVHTVQRWGGFFRAKGSVGSSEWGAAVESALALAAFIVYFPLGYEI